MTQDPKNARPSAPSVVPVSPVVVNPAPGLLARTVPPLAWLAVGAAIGYYLGQSHGRKRGRREGGANANP
jgi:hypothetical protein